MTEKILWVAMVLGIPAGLSLMMGVTLKINSLVTLGALIGGLQLFLAVTVFALPRGPYLK